jgi:flavin-dependent dehydrogenase
MLCRQAAAAGAEFFASRPVRQWRRESEGWRLGEIRARVLVDASGRNSLGVAYRLLEVDDRLLAAVLRLSGAATPDLRTYIEAVPLGWWYTAVLPDEKLVAMFFTDRAASARAALTLEGLGQSPLTAARLRAASVVSRRVVPVCSGCARSLFGDGWVLVGDAASSYDPISGRGIFKALRHGAAAAEAVDRRLCGSDEGLCDYAARVHREFRDYAAARKMYYAMETRWAAEPFWRARASRSRNA